VIFDGHRDDFSVLPFFEEFWAMGQVEFYLPGKPAYRPCVAIGFAGGTQAGVTP